MKTTETCAAQGDVLFRRVAKVPDGFTQQKPAKEIVVSHSETGHHHVIDGMGVVHYSGADPRVCYLQLAEVDHVDVRHLRAWDTHEALRLIGPPGSIFEVRRQQEFTPEGWRRVQD